MKIQKGAITETVNIRRVTPFHKLHDQDHGGACNEQTCVSNEIRKRSNQLLSDHEDVSLGHHQHSSAKPDKTISSILKPRRRSDRLSKQVIR